MGRKILLRREDSPLPNSNVRPVIPQVFHKHTEYRFEFIHIHCTSTPVKELTQASISNALFIYSMS